MNFRCFAILIALGMSACVAVTYPAQTISEKVAPGVHGRMILPEGEGPFPGILMLHGASGVIGSDDQTARALSAEGFAVLVLDYYRGGADLVDGDAGRTPDHIRMRWLSNIERGAEYLRNHQQILPDEIGIVGFSRGAQYGLKYANEHSEILAVIGYYGLLYDYDEGQRPDLKSVENLPPTLLLHGKADKIVPIGYAYEIMDLMERAGRHAELVTFPDMSHAWWFVDTSDASQSAWRESVDVSVRFLRDRFSRQ